MRIIAAVTDPEVIAAHRRGISSRLGDGPFAFTRKKVTKAANLDWVLEKDLIERLRDLASSN